MVQQRGSQQTNQIVSKKNEHWLILALILRSMCGSWSSRRLSYDDRVTEGNRYHQ